MRIRELMIKKGCNHEAVELLNKIFSDPIYVTSSMTGRQLELTCKIQSSMRGDRIIFYVNGFVDIIDINDNGSEIFFEDLTGSNRFDLPYGRYHLGVAFHELLKFTFIEDNITLNNCPQISTQELKKEISEICKKGVLIHIHGCTIPDYDGPLSTTPIGVFGTGYLLKYDENFNYMYFYIEPEDEEEQIKYCEILDTGMVLCGVGSAKTFLSIQNTKLKEKLTNLNKLLKIAIADETSNKSINALDAELSGRTVKVIESKNGRVFPGGIGYEYKLWYDTIAKQLWLLRASGIFKVRSIKVVHYSNNNPYFVQCYIEHNDTVNNETYYFHLVNK